MAKQQQETFQEYADSRGQQLRVDRAAGVIHGVKLLGTQSKHGREYPAATIAKAIPLYEGCKVNVDHVKPGERRSLRDRIGVVRNVQLKEDGLYADFHYNPKHVLAEQVAWDAENSPENLGFSHDSRGQSVNRGGRVVVESIDRVLSVDLVANPATTAGLFEDYDPAAAAPGTTHTNTPTAGGQMQESTEVDWKTITLDELKANRPDLVQSFQESLEASDTAKRDREELAQLRAEKAARVLRESIDSEIKAAGLDTANKAHVSEVFLEDLTATSDQGKRAAKIADRKALVESQAPAKKAPTTGPTPTAMQESADVPPVTAPLADRVRRFMR